MEVVTNPDTDLSAATAVVSGARNLPFSFAKRYGVFLQYRGGGEVPALCHQGTIALTTYAEVRRFLQQPFICLHLDEKVFAEQLSAAYERNSSDAMQMVESLGDEMDITSLANAVQESEDLMEQEGDAPIIRLINALLTEAVKQNASDIHIETFEKRLVVRFRVDGVLREAVEPRRELAPLLISRIKVMAKLDIAEKRVPQDGRISLRVAGREIDVRVSTMPSNDSERVVLRLLEKEAGRLSLNALGMPRLRDQQFNRLLNRPHGIILVTGPTGSGKTTTLYAGLSAINNSSRNILTVEDPVEYNLEGIGQTQVNPKADMTFARGLRAMLRQDPDVVMVGEIRDLETAQIAVQASLTGHLVLSTLHTNSAAGAITRLRDMGVEPFLLATSLLGVLAQRLVRVLCKECKVEQPPSILEREFLGDLLEGDDKIFAPVGCESCNHQGYKGRTGIYELLIVDEQIRQLIHNESSEEDVINAMRMKSMLSIREDGRARIIEGVTTVEEVLRVTLED
ncbi:type II secretion system ATPase GspE [Oceanicoccus sp. KOV_DT_Chl]|uniref:type II secretion system ATPase GspE n=1 Tax=Oceanicoccus sp. KOV_DT_Chl TaxID=1904639 RepID=UPI000C7E37DF|nr:type II secretion system ATPase GspE [Oceanicoccus sp. KOV_DT_Chl]